MMHLALTVAMAAAPVAEPQRLALVIAHNHSLDSDVRSLRFADDDGARFYELLTALGFETHLLTVLDDETAEQHPKAARAARPPSWDRLERTIQTLRRRVASAHAAGHEVELLLTYSGHGAVGRRGVPYVNLLDRRLYRGDFFRDVVAGVGADFVHTIIDACRARDFVDARGGPDGPDFARELSLFLAQERRAQHPEVGVIVAESADGETHEWSRTRSGIFGHEVISGLAGGADLNEDGRVEYSELHAFVAAANDALRDPRARLRVVAQPPPLDARRPVIRLTGGSERIRIRTPDEGGRYTVEDDRGVRWLDVHLAEGHAATLHLPPGRRYFVVDVHGTREVVVDPTPGSEPVRLAALSFAPIERTVARGSIDAALRSDLFRTAFGPLFYRGFVVAMRYPAVETRQEEAPALVAPVASSPPAAPAASAAASAAPAHEAAEEAQHERAEAELEAQTREAAARLEADAEAALALRPQPREESWPALRVTRYASGGVSMAASLLAGALGYRALQRQRQAQDQAQVRAAQTLEEARSLALYTNVLLTTALVGATIWGITWLLD